MSASELSLPSSDPLSFAAWDGPVVTPDVVEKYQEFADAGFTYNMTVFVDEEQARIGLDAAHKAGVKVLTRYWPHSPTVKPADMARLFKDHPGLGGYVLQDEPVISEFPAVLARAKEVLAADPDPGKIICVNLLPVYAGHEMLELKPHQKYEDYVCKFLSEVPVNVLSYDHYPLKRLGVIKSWYENMLIGQRVARSAEIPFWPLISCCSADLFPDPTLGVMRIQTYTNLAMGAAVVVHAVYCTNVGREAPYVCGRRTHVYDLVKQVNHEIQAQAGVFVGSKTWYNPRWSGPDLPRVQEGWGEGGYQAYKPSGPIQSLATGNKNALVNCLQKEAYRFLVIVNQDFLEPMPLSVSWRADIPIGRVQRDGSVQMLNQASLETNVDPGDAAILMWMASDK